MLKSYLIGITFALLGLVCCKPDDFYNVTKIIEAPAEIQFNRPFKFKLILKNETDSILPLTLDKEITKSLSFYPDWYCGKERLVQYTPNSSRKNTTIIL